MKVICPQMVAWSLSLLGLSPIGHETMDTLALPYFSDEMDAFATSKHTNVKVVCMLELLAKTYLFPFI